jgi:hypothetical protein
MLDTMKVATMDAWTPVPLESSTINKMNALAALPTQVLPSELEFLMSTKRVEDLGEDEPDTAQLEREYGRREMQLREPNVPDYDPTQQAVELDDGLPARRGAPVELERPGVIEATDAIASEYPAPAAYVEQVADLQGETAAELSGAIPPEPDGESMLPDVEPHTSESPESAAVPDTAPDIVSEVEPGQLVQTEETDEAPPQFGLRRYALRPNRHYGHREGPWEDRREIGLHLTVRAAKEKYKAAADISMLQEIQSIHDKGVLLAVLGRL